MNKNIERLNELLNELIMWPEWKLDAMLLDESDLVVKKMVGKRKDMINMMLDNFLNEKIDYVSSNLNISLRNNTKKLIK